ncbi:putative coiled-coil protein SlyX [Bradyrhizobium sp. LB7.2]
MRSRRSASASTRWKRASPIRTDTIETLNQTITAQWRQIDALTRKIAELGERLQEAEANAPGAANEPPPHY